MNWYKKALENTGIKNTYSPNVGVAYHASPKDNLDAIGLSPNQTPVNKYIKNKRSEYIYLGSKNYIFTQFFNYTGPGIYSLYEINTSGLNLEPLPTGEQWRTTDPIETNRIKKIGKYNVTKHGYQEIK